MAKGGGAPAPLQGQVYLPEWHRAYDRLVKMVRREHALAEELSVERVHLLTERVHILAELEFERSGRREREDIFQDRFQRIWRDEERRKRAEKAEAAKLLGDKELELRCYQKLAELTESDLEDFRSSISALAAENTELKTKLKEVESQADLSENTVDHRHSAKDLRAELRKLKKAYKTLSSEKDQEIKALRAEKSFAWNQFKTMEEEYRGTIQNKSIEARQATEAARQLQQNVDELRVSVQQLQQNVDELQVSAQKKDDEIGRLQAEVTNAKEYILILEDELQQMRSLVKDKDVETYKNKDDQPETSRKWKKDINESNRKSKSEGPVLREKSRNSQVTPDRREVKTSRTRTSKAQNFEERGHSETSQKRKRGSSLSRGPRRCSTRLPQVKTAVSPMLLPPSFTVPRLKTPTPP